MRTVFYCLYSVILIGLGMGLITSLQRHDWITAIFIIVVTPLLMAVARFGVFGVETRG
jgi:thiol:disulfide interchange protein